MVPVIGTLYDSMKNMKLQMRFAQRKQNPYLPKGEEDPQITRLREDAARVRRSNKVMELDSKLRAGAQLTSQELAYLRDNHPELYREAMEIRRERQAYKEKLRRCKTQEEVDHLQMQTLQGFAGQVKAVSANANLPQEKKLALLDHIAKRLAAVSSEQTQFVRSGAYDRLPREEERRQERPAQRQRGEDAAAQREPLPVAQLLRELHQALHPQWPGSGQAAGEPMAQRTPGGAYNAQGQVQPAPGFYESHRERGRA